MQETPGCCVCTDLCGYDRDPGLCLVSTFSPFILLSQLVERLQKGTCLGTFVGIVSLEVLAAVFFYEVEEAQVEAWARVFNMITCASPTWSSVAGIKGGLPQWMTNSGNNDVKDGTVCEWLASSPLALPLLSCGQTHVLTTRLVDLTADSPMRLPKQRAQELFRLR